MAVLYRQFTAMLKECHILFCVQLSVEPLILHRFAGREVDIEID